MADDKYAGLPGIVRDQPDVYESNDLPESEQIFHDAESGDTNPAFEEIHISTREGLEHFQGKSVSSKDVDFSDSVCRLSHTGYKTTRRIEWGIGVPDDESVVEKYQRLKAEMVQLEEQVQDLKGPVDFAGGSVDEKELKEGVADLQKTIDEIGKGNVIKQRQQQGNHKNNKDTSKSPEKKKSTEKSSEISCPSQLSDEKNVVRLAKLEKRIQALDILLGDGADKMTSLSAWTGERSVCGWSQWLRSRLSLLEPSHLDAIENRLHAVATRVQNLSAAKKNCAPDTEKMAKMTELLESSKKCELIATSLPEVVARMSALEHLHEQAKEFGGAMSELNVSQNHLANLLTNNLEFFSTTENKFSQSFTDFKENITKLETRIEELGKKQNK